MGLPAALKAHGEGNLALAATHYERALQQKQLKPVLFQNYGALLRGNGDLERSEKVYRDGINLFPRHLGTLRNYANLKRELGEVAEALRINLTAMRIALKDGDDKALELVYCECIDLLHQQESSQWAIALLRQAFQQLGVTTKLLWLLFRLSADDRVSSFDTNQSRVILSSIEARLAELQPVEHAEFLFNKGYFLAKIQHDGSSAVRAVRNAQDILNSAEYKDQSDRDAAQKLMDLNSWNSACMLLKESQFQPAWKLFEWGLRAPAQGRQRWQRAVKKLFTHQEVPLWRGEPLEGSRLLLLEEQAVGDTMMFLTLLPVLVQHASHVGILMCSRLVPIYKRSCQEWIAQGCVSIWSHDEASEGRLTSDGFDFQSPVGSICQYIANEIGDFSPKTPVLVAEHGRALAFKNTASRAKAKPLRIGISWRGGGRSDRIKLKSIDVNLMADLMRDHGSAASFVNLQYGDTNSVIDDWQSQGLHVVNEPTVNPLKNMEHWLDLVASCDAVISVANTTIHGAGGLNIPTLCLLSQHADWRWLSGADVCRSYWYPSVGIAREHVDDGWMPAFRQVSQWISAGCPMPDGPVHTEYTGKTVEQALVSKEHS